MGLMNGVGIAMGRISPLIMTLAMMYMGRGLAFMYSGGLPIYGIRPAFIQFGNGFTAGIPNSVLYFVALLILSIAVLRCGTRARSKLLRTCRYLLIPRRATREWKRRRRSSRRCRSASMS